MIYQHLINFWPLVPAVDILTMYDTLKTNSISSDDYDIPFSDYRSRQQLPCPISHDTNVTNVLIVADGVGCLFKTLARMARHETPQLNLYVVSCFPESVARILLLLSLFTVPIEAVGVLERAEMFLEIFGNTFLRSSTAGFVETKAAEILEDLSAESAVLRSLPMVSTEHLKQREKDEICKVLSYLKSVEPRYDVAKAREASLRAYYGTRYDSRRNLFDYLYHMKLSHYPVIGLRNYLEWCESGMAFRLRKAKYDRPNKTLRLKTGIPGKTAANQDFYCGDIATSPYIAFGVECKNENMFEKVNNEYKHSGEDISKFNVIDFMTEVAESGNCDGRKVRIYPCMFATFLKSGGRFKKFFDVAYVSCDMMNCAENKAVRNALKGDGVVVFETIQNVVNSTKEQKNKYYEEADRIARACGWKGINNWECSGCFKTYGNNDVRV